MLLHSTTAVSPTPGADSRERLQTAARGLEARFAQLMIESMRSASLGDSMLGGDTMYRDMYDQKLSRALTRGDGLGLASMIVRQLSRSLPDAPVSQLAADAGRAVAPPLDTLMRDTGNGLPLMQNLPMPMPLSRPVPAPIPLPAISNTLALTPSSHGVSLSAVAAVPPPTITALPPTAGPDACNGDAPLDCSTPEAFVRSIWPHAQRTAAELGISAKALVAQAALETGWGRRLVGGDDSHNLFGIKATGGWGGDSVQSATHEFIDGQRQNLHAQFRAYNSVHDSFADYAQLMRNDRYAGALAAGTDADRFAVALQRAGYATDPAYAAKISAIVDGPTLRRALAALPDATVRG